jgi:hypothetical protein
MGKNKINLASLQHKLSRDEMKRILGGGDGDTEEGSGGGCPGIIECPTLEVGTTCPDVGSSTGCTCRSTSSGNVCKP